MAITISGENNNDRILAQDGVIDSISGFNIAGIITASSFTGDLTGDVTGNLSGNVTGNINNTTLLLQTGGSERVRIDSNGKVGVGVNPSAYPGKFVVSGDALICDRDIHSRVANSVANSDRGFKQDTDGVEKLHLYADNSSHIILEGNNGVEKLRIQSNGKVGIGTDFVDANLTVHTDTPGEVVFNIHADLGTNNNRTFNLYAPATDSSGDPYIFQTGNSMQFKVDSHEGIKIHSNGYIGIGTNTPTELFDVHSNDSAILRLYTKNVSSNASLNLRGGNNGNSKIVFGDTADHDIGEIRYNHYNNNNYMSFHTNTGERLRIDSNGRVLIGHDTTPAAVASVAIVGSYGASSYLTPFVYLCRDEDGTSISTNESLGQILFASRDGYRGAVIEANAAGAWSGSSSDGYLVFKTTPDNATVPVERLRLDSSGNVTVKTNDVTFGGSGTLRINSGSTAGSLNLDGGSSNHGGEINLFGGSNGGRILFRTGQGAGQQTEKMRLSENGQLSIGAAPASGLGLLNIKPRSDLDSFIKFRAASDFDGTFDGTAIDNRNSANSANKDLIVRFNKLALWPGGSSKISITNSGVITLSEQLIISNALPSIKLIDSGNNHYAYLDGNSGNLIIHSDKGNTGGSSTLKFAVDNNVKMTIGHSGRVGVAESDSGISGYAENFQVRATYGSGQYGIAVKLNHSSGSLMRFANSSGLCGSITSSGSNSTSFNTSSDYRLKENDVKISDGISRLKQLRPIRFNWKSDSSSTEDGFFAHEVTPAVPEAITGEKDASIDEIGEGYQKIDYGKLVPLLTAALQEAVARIEALEGS